MGETTRGGHVWGQHRHRWGPLVPPQAVLTPPLPFCPSTPWTPPETKASLWSWPTGPLPAAFFACFLSGSRSALGSAPPPPARLYSWGSEQSPLCCPAQGPPTVPIPPVNRSGPRRERALGARPLGLWSHQEQVESPSIRALAVWSVPLSLFSSIKMGENNSHPMGLSDRLNVSQTPSSSLPHSGGTV